MKIVLDTNIIISGLFWSGTPKKILELLDEKKIDAFATSETLEEYEEMIERFCKKSGIDSKSIFQAIAGKFHIVKPVKLAAQICDDPDDDMFIACALSANAKYIVSGDQKLLTVGKFKTCKIITAGEFIKNF